ncbi:cobalt transport protein ATP-binding subunit [Thermoplasmatales archaeon BRNA1]|nr:cobalt transport protein ATP-binding subunit [Thermoplasmatales archaeon BRNA1]
MHHPGLPKVLDGFNIEIEEGSRTAILGANGAGKTTLFYTLTGVYKPQEGEVLYRGQPIEYTKEGLTRVRSDVAVVLQNPDEQMFCSIVEEDIAFGPLNLGVDRDEVDARIEKALRDVRMTEYRRRPLQQLSGGQRKRIAIAGALAVQPEVLIMDEPTAGLDPQASMEVIELAEKMSLSGVTVLISTHDVDLAYSWADSVAVLRHGKKVFSGSSEDFYGNSEEVHLCGLLSPSTFNMNREISNINGVPHVPYPHNVCEFLSKFAKGTQRPGRVFCVPCCDDTLAQYQSAVKDAESGAKIGVYGSDTRYELSKERIDFYFDGIDSCFTEAVLGRDSILFYDSIYSPIVRQQAEALKEFGCEIELEVVQ